MRTTWKRGLSFVVSASMVLGLVPTPALAQITDAPEDDGPAVELVSTEGSDAEEVTPGSQTPETSQTDATPQDGISLEEPTATEPSATTEAPTTPTTTETPTPDDDPSVTTQSNATITQMQLDTAYRAEAPEDGYWVGSFTAPQDGTYVFYSENVNDDYCDTYGHLYADEEFNDELADDDDSNDNGQFKIKYTLTAGTTVYLQVHQYSYDALKCNATVVYVDASDLSQGYYDYSSTRYAFTGNPIELSATVYDVADNALVAGKDFEFVYVDGDGNESTNPPSRVGSYQVYARAIGSYYKGRVNGSFWIEVYDPYDISGGDFSCYFDGSSTIEYTGKQVVLPDVVIEYYDRELYDYVQLTNGKDFRFSYVKDYDGHKLSAMPSQIGTYYAVYEGISPYNGTTELCFSIRGNRYDLTLASVHLDGTTVDYTGSAVELNPGVYDANGSYVDEDDYVLVYYGENGAQLAGAPSAKGTYYVAARAQSGTDFTGETPKVRFSICGTENIGHSSYYSDFSHNTVASTGGPVVLPAARIYRWDDDLDEEVYLTQGVDFEFDHFEDSNGNDLGTTVVDPGYYVVVYRGKSDYSGYRGIPLHVVDPHDLDYASVSVSKYNVPLVDGKATPQVTVTDFAGNELTQGTDYELVYSYDGRRVNPPFTNEGSYYVYAVPGSNGTYFNETSSTWFNVYDPNDISKSSWSGEFIPSSLVALGAQKLPTAVIYRWSDDQELTLLEGTHFELDHIDSVPDDDQTTPTNYGKTIPSTVGQYRAVYKGIGSYKGTRSLYFWVFDSYDLSAEDQYGSKYWQTYFWPSNMVALGSTQTPTPVIYHMDEEDYYSNVRLELNKDFELSRIEDASGKNLGTAVPNSAGNYYAVYRGKNSYHGETRISFSVYADNNIESNYWSVSFRGGSNIYTDGGPVELPQLLVYRYDNKVSLVEGKDFKFVRYVDEDGGALAQAPSEQGDYYAVYEGIGNYTGTRRVPFTIYTSYNLSNATLKLGQTAYEATGKPVVIEAKVRDSSGIKLDPSTDYELAYRNADGEELKDGAPSEQGTYYVAAKARSGSRYLGLTSWETFTIGEVGPDPGPSPTAVPMALDEPQNVKVAENEYWLGSFTAPADGVYVFSSTGNYDTYGILYADARMNEELARNDDGGDDNNFRVTQVLKANQTVYLKARGYGNKAMACSVGVTKLDERDLTNATVDTETEDYVLQGSVLIPQVVVTDAAGTTLTEGTHYTLCYYQYSYETYDYVKIDKVTQAGEYYVVATATQTGGYKNQTQRASIVVYDANDLAGARITQTSARYKVGTDVTANITVTDRTGKELTRGTDYELVFYQQIDNLTVRIDAAPTTVGEYYVGAKAVGSTYTGRTGIWSFTIYDPYNIAVGGYAYLNGYEYSANMGYESVPVYRYTGSPVTPSANVYCDGSLDEDEYSITYTNNDKPSTDGSLATATITGLTPYSGTITKQFMIVSQINLASLANDMGIRVTAGDEMEYWYNQSYSMSFLVEGWPTDPDVQIMTYGDNTPIQGRDFTVSFADEDGKPLANTPSTIGKYQLVLTPTTSGLCTGEARLRFSLVGTRDLDGSSSPSLHDSWYFSASGSYDEDGVYTISFDDVLGSVGAYFVDIYQSGKTLIENLDYVVRSVGDGILELVGIGSYEDSMRVRVVGSENTQAAFDARSASVGDTIDVDGHYTNVVYCASDGTLLAPSVRMSGLTYGADFTFDAFENASGATITSARVGDAVNVRVKGVGSYSGCQRKIGAVVAEGTGVQSLSDAEATMQLTNGLRVYENGKTQWYLLRSAVPNVSVVVYRRMRLILTQDQGLIVTSTVSSTNKTIDVKATVAEGLPLKGSLTLQANLVDSYDITKFGKTIRVSDNFGRQSTYTGSGAVKLGYTGTAYMPTVTVSWSGGSVSGSSLTTTLKNAKGTAVSEITGPGEYTLVVAGKGDWTGSYTIPVTVTTAAGVTSLDGFSMQVGNNTELVNGVSKPTVTMSCGAVTLVEGKDYTVTYGNNTNVGERGWVKVTAKSGSGYTGTRKANFVVGTSTMLRKGDFALYLANPRGGGFVDATSGTYSYTVRGNVGPAVKVYRTNDNGAYTELDVSKYSVTYGDLATTGLSYVKVTGKNGFTGSLSANFYVVASEPLSIAKATVTLGATSYTYNGKVKSPGVKSVVLNGVTLVEGTDYKVTAPSGRKNAGTYTYTVTGIGAYMGTAKASFKIKQAASSIKLAAQTKTYNGKVQAYSGTVTKTGSTGKVTYAYYSDAKGKKSVKASAVKNAAVYYVRAALAADTNHKSAKSALVKFTIAKAANPMKVTVSNPSISYGTLKKSAVTVAPFTVTKNQGKVTYAKTSGNAAFTVNTTTGKITVKKGTKKGKYTIKVTIKAAGSTNYKVLNKAVTTTITVK